MKTRDSGMPSENYWETFFNPPTILESLELHRAEGLVVDVGAGYGTFTLAVARLTRQQVLAIDIEPEVLELLAAKAEANGLDNVKTVLRDIVVEGFGLPEESADIVLLFNILHCENPLELLRKARQALRPGGRVGVLHWRSDVPTPRGPDLSIRPTPDQCVTWLRDSGFELAIPPRILPPYHFGLVGRKAGAQAA